MGKGRIGYGGSCTKYVLFVFNIIFWISGAAILGVGILTLVDANIQQYLEVAELNTGDPSLKVAAYVLIGVGSFIFLVGFLGCCGACQESSWMLYGYIFLLGLVIAGQLAAGILAAVYRDKLEGSLLDGMKTQIRNEYRKGSVLQKAWDFVQVNFECCGAESYIEYRNSIWYVREGLLNGKFVPSTCCRLKSHDPTNPEPENEAICQLEASAIGDRQLYWKGCYPRFIDWVKRHATIVLGVVFGLAGIQIFCLVFAIITMATLGTSTTQKTEPAHA